jgi:Ca2+-binding RTX toxin-like protein
LENLGSQSFDSTSECFVLFNTSVPIRTHEAGFFLGLNMLGGVGSRADLLVVVGTGADLLVVVGTGADLLVVVGTGADLLVVVGTGADLLVVVGTRADLLVVVGTGAGLLVELAIVARNSLWISSLSLVAKFES